MLCKSPFCHNKLIQNFQNLILVGVGKNDCFASHSMNRVLCYRSSHGFLVYDNIPPHYAYKHAKTSHACAQIIIIITTG